MFPSHHLVPQTTTTTSPSHQVTKEQSLAALHLCLVTAPHFQSENTMESTGAR